MQIRKRVFFVTEANLLLFINSEALKIKCIQLAWFENNIFWVIRRQSTRPCPLLLLCHVDPSLLLLFPSQSLTYSNNCDIWRLTFPSIPYRATFTTTPQRRLHTPPLPPTALISPPSHSTSSHFHPPLPAFRLWLDVLASPPSSGSMNVNVGMGMGEGGDGGDAGACFGGSNITWSSVHSYEELLVYYCIH